MSKIRTEQIDEHLFRVEFAGADLSEVAESDFPHPLVTVDFDDRGRVIGMSAIGPMKPHLMLLFGELMPEDGDSHVLEHALELVIDASGRGKGLTQDQRDDYIIALMDALRDTGYRHNGDEADHHDHDLERAIHDTNRTLSKMARGDGHFTVRALEVEWLGYDEERDGLFLDDPRRVVRIDRDPTELEG
jgi:hypothetical protein